MSMIMLDLAQWFNIIQHMHNNNPSEPSNNLDAFDPALRLQALQALAANAKLPPPSERINMHIHSFFSYNTYGYSPSHIAWQARQSGLYAAGLCDFDVLDGLEEFLAAGRTLGLRTTVNLETRVFLSEYANLEISSPGEPGISYIMGLAFPRAPANGSRAAATLAQYRNQAAQRNMALVRRINAGLQEIAIDYDLDLMPLCPAQCPTERHIVRAYRQKAAKVFPSISAQSAFWAHVMKTDPQTAAQWSASIPVMEDKIRAALVKKGSIGYEPPTERTFPRAEIFINWALACRALPAVTWLDGTSAGESDASTLMECLRAKGACALNIIPDRNHNIADPKVRALKLKKLDEIIQTADGMGFPINIGTEMNKDGQPFADETSAGVLQPYHAIFMRGARILTGHAILARWTKMDYAGAAAQAEFGGETQRKNDFFATVGALPPLTERHGERLSQLGPERAYDLLRDSSARGAWQ